MRGRSAHRLLSTCIQPNEQYICEPFKTATMHIFHVGTALGGYPNYYELATCGTNINAPGTIDTKKLPISLPFKMARNGRMGYTWGFTGESIYTSFNPKKIPHIRNCYFKEEDLKKWAYRRMFRKMPMPNGGEFTEDTSKLPGLTDPGFPPIYTTGPAIKNYHACYPVRRRTACDPPYSNYLNWCFTDEGATHMLNQDGSERCPKDGLGYSYPAKYIWHNSELDQPFLGNEWWEDNGTTPVTEESPECYGFIPFCSPMDAYNAAGELLGQYVGYSHVMFFNNNFYVGGNDQGKNTNAKPGNMPLDPTDNDPKPRPVKRFKDSHSIDVHVYMVAKPLPGKILKSPRLGSRRVWRPNNVLSFSGTPYGVGICTPYLYFIAADVYGQWGIRISVNVLEGGTTQRVMSMGKLVTFLVP